MGYLGKEGTWERRLAGHAWDLGPGREMSEVSWVLVGRVMCAAQARQTPSGTLTDAEDSGRSEEV